MVIWIPSPKRRDKYLLNWWSLLPITLESVPKWVSEAAKDQVCQHFSTKMFGVGFFSWEDLNHCEKLKGPRSQTCGLMRHVSGLWIGQNPVQTLVWCLALCPSLVHSAHFNEQRMILRGGSEGLDNQFEINMVALLVVSVQLLRIWSYHFTVLAPGQPCDSGVLIPKHCFLKVLRSIFLSPVMTSLSHIKMSMCWRNISQD